MSLAIEELWGIPKAWAWTSINGIGDVVGGGTPSTKEQSYWGNDVNWISPSDLSGRHEKSIERGAKGLSELGLLNSSAKVLPKGSVLFSSRAPIGYVAIASGPVATNQGFRSLVPANGVDNEFVYYYLRASKQLAQSRASGTTFLELSGSAFAALPIPIAPLNEQRRIVAKIEEQFSELDKGVESLKTAQQQLKAYRQAVLKHAFEGKLTADWRAKSPGHDWMHGRFGNYFRLQGGYAFKSDDYCDDGVPLIRIGDIQSDRVAPSERTALLPASYLEDNPSFVVMDGDILVAMSGATTGKFGIYTGQQRSLLNQRVGRVLARESKIEIPRELVWYFLTLSQPEILRRAYGGAQPNISSKGIEDLDFKFPGSKEEMILLVSRLETALSRNDKTFEMISAELSRSEALRQSVLKRAFSGQLVPQDPNDEPASVLLDRIKAEKANAATGAKKKKDHAA
jgi:type I restriction enzyme, S subunit